MISLHFPNLVNLDVSYNSNVTEIVVEKIFIACPKLQSIDLNGCKKLSEEFVIKLRSENPSSP